MDPKITNIADQLVESARKGNQQSMYKLYKMNVQAMYSTCIRIVGNQLDAEDIVQESFVTAFSTLGSFRGQSSFSTWLKRIVINKSLNHLKRKKLTFTDLGSHPIEDDTDSEADFPEIPLHEVHQAIKELPEKARIVLTLYLVEGYLHREIADMLGISESTSKSQFQRARNLLKETLLKKVSLGEIV